MDENWRFSLQKLGRIWRSNEFNSFVIPPFLVHHGAPYVLSKSMQILHFRQHMQGITQACLDLWYALLTSSPTTTESRIPSCRVLEVPLYEGLQGPTKTRTFPRSQLHEGISPSSHPTLQLSPLPVGSS